MSVVVFVTLYNSLHWKAAEEITHDNIIQVVWVEKTIYHLASSPDDKVCVGINVVFKQDAYNPIRCC